MKLKDYLVNAVKNMGYNIDDCDNINDLVKFLPENYSFCEQRLWCGGVYVDADGYDYANAVLKMIIKLNENE